MSREQQRTISQHWHRGYACACAVCSAYRETMGRSYMLDGARASFHGPEAEVLERAEHGQLETLRHLFR